MSEATLNDVVSAVESQTKLLTEILKQTRETNGRVSRLERAEDARVAEEAIVEKMRSRGWHSPEDTEKGLINWKAAAPAAGIIGTVVAGVALGISKALGF